MDQPKDINYTTHDGSLNIKVKFSRKWSSDFKDRLQYVQKVVDSEVIRQTTPYVPMQTGTLEKSALLNTVIGSGEVVYATPYARYLYYGEVYGPNYPIIQQGELVGFFSPPHKEPTGFPLIYDTSFHPLAGKMWFERMKKDHAQDIQAAAQQAANSGAK